MYLEKISLFQFKNYLDLNVSFSEGTNIIFGLNGSGKTNLLDAIHMLCLAKSAVNHNDQHLIKQDTNQFVVSGDFKKLNKKHKVSIGLQKGTKKLLKVNKKEYKKLIEHIGKFPIVIILPNDTDIIREGSETRRKFFDNLFSQIDPLYLDNLVKYNHVLKQRNALLKQFDKNNFFDPLQLEPYNVLLCKYAKYIHEIRKNSINNFVSLFQEHYKTISQENESVDLFYESKLSKTPLEELLVSNIDKDRILSRTNAGIHKDDFIFNLEDNLMKKFGSQGQQKSFILALKFAQFDLIKETLKLTPILLLDDIFDKLDENRILKLLETIQSENFGQVFITDARKDRTIELLKTNKLNAQIIEIKSGTLSKDEKEV